ncbi:MAG: hypothetical protein C4318_02540 [Acidimicrobiia bacterium]|mgnify:CR=1 FL=1
MTTKNKDTAKKTSSAKEIAKKTSAQGSRATKSKASKAATKADKQTQVKPTAKESSRSGRSAGAKSAVTKRAKTAKEEGGTGRAKVSGSKAKQITTTKSRAQTTKQPSAARRSTVSRSSVRKAAEPKASSKKRGAKLPARLLATARKRLEEERLRLLAQIEELEKERQILAEDREDRDDAFTEESGEGASTLAEQEREESLSIRMRELLEKVERAMQKIAKGTYGLCERCGNPIERLRLEALPYAELCIECKRREERRF